MLLVSHLIEVLFIDLFELDLLLFQTHVVVDKLIQARLQRYELITATLHRMPSCFCRRPKETSVAGSHLHTSVINWSLTSAVSGYQIEVTRGCRLSSREVRVGVLEAA